MASMVDRRTGPPVCSGNRLRLRGSVAVITQPRPNPDPMPLARPSPAVPSRVGRIFRTAREVWAFGLAASVRLWRALRSGERGEPRRFPAPDATSPPWYRPGTSDLRVFRQIFFKREYRCLDDLHDARLVVDCGANVGYASVYFLSRFPNAEVYAIEPDAGNAAFARRNLAPYGGRVRLREAAVWSAPGSLRIERKGLGSEWGIEVRPCDVDEGDVEAIDLSSVIAELGNRRISILKIDIEGAEAEVFRDGPPPWLALVDAIVIELHGPACEAAFLRCVPESEWDISACDELTVCRRRAGAGRGK